MLRRCKFVVIAWAPDLSSRALVSPSHLLQTRTWTSVSRRCDRIYHRSIYRTMCVYQQLRNRTTRPGEAPLTLVATAVQLYVVPVTLFGLEITIEVDSPEQIVWSVADALVTGRTVTTS